MITEWMEETIDIGPPEYDPYGFMPEGMREHEFGGYEVQIFRRDPVSEKFGIQFEIGGFLLEEKADNSTDLSMIQVKGVIVKKQFKPDGTVLYWVRVAGFIQGETKFR